MERTPKGALTGMLRQITVRDFVIVDYLDLEFAGGFGALTGETGAGKSILVDALALALGERAEAGVVRSGCDRAEVTASFTVGALPLVGAWLDAHDFSGGDELLLRRVVDAGGRSRAYINGSPATVQQLREVGESLVDIHGQHAHQSLLRGEAQRSLLDAYGGLGETAAEVGTRYRAWQAAQQALALATAGGEALAREREQLLWQVEELQGLGFTVEEWNDLEVEHKRLTHAASLIEGAQYCLALLAEGDAACEGAVDRATARLGALASYDPELAEVAGLVQSVQAELAEAISNLRRYCDRIELDPARLGEVEQRLNAIYSAARKYRCQPAELVDLLARWQVRLAELTEGADLEALRRRVATAQDEFLGTARSLSRGRERAAAELSAAASALMRQLALASSNLSIALVPVDGGAAAFGCESVEFRVSGLADAEARPLAKVVSGGELSRISLSIQVVASRSTQVPTLIFDEVDVGIGGGVAEIVGRLLRDLGRERQVLCITHLPQVAARADWQWLVSKTVSANGTLSRIACLDQAGRVAEIARMLGGVEITEITLSHARELLGAV